MSRRVRVVEVFNSVVEYYDSWYETPLGRYVVKAEVKALQHLLPPRGVGVDVGGGTGVFTREIINDRWALCLDPAIQMLRRASRRGVDVICGVAEKPPLRESSLDFAFMVTVLEFLEDPLEGLSGIKPLLKRGGVLVVMIVNRDSAWGKLYNELAERGEPVLSLAKLFTLRELVSLLEEAGFKLVEVIGTLDNPPDVVPEEEPRLLSTGLDECGVLFLKAVPSEWS